MTDTKTRAIAMALKVSKEAVRRASKCESAQNQFAGADDAFFLRTLGAAGCCVGKQNNWRAKYSHETAASCDRLSSGLS